MQPTTESKWQHLHRLRLPDASQLNQIETRLNLVLLAVVAIADLDSEALWRTAQELELTEIVGRLRQWQQTRLEVTNVEAARSLVLIISHLAKQNQELIRRAVSLLEQTQAERKEPELLTLLKDYLNRFIALHQAKSGRSPAATDLSPLAWKLLTDLLFYSGNNGHCLLWLAILDPGSRSRN